MARYCKKLTSLLLISLLLISCQEGGDAGELLGQWRLEGKENMYLSFSGSITQFRNNNGQRVFAKFQHVGDSLFMQCSSIYKEQSDTTMIENDFGMKPFSNIRVKIEALDSDHMTLSKDSQRWLLEKY